MKAARWLPTPNTFANDMLGAISVLFGLAVIALRDPLHVPEWLATRADAIAALIVAAIAFRSVWNLGSKVRPSTDGRCSDRTHGPPEEARRIGRRCRQRDRQ